MNTNKMDLNHLLTFEAMLETRSVSKASERLGVSQPSMSHALAKMRAAFGDPLFVRVKNEMQPTPHALQIAEPVSRALALARSEVFQTQSFDPATAERTFTLCMTDVGVTSYLPAVVNALSRLAPRIGVRTITPIAEKHEEGLEAGLVDLAIGYFPDVKSAGVYQQRLLRNTGFVCIAGQNNPYVGKHGLTLESFTAAPQVAIRTEGRSHEVIEQAMTERKIERRVMVTSPHYLGLFTLISGTDLIAIIPNDLAGAFQRQEGVRIHPLPFPSPTVEIKQIWHRRFHRDGANKWIREVVRRCLQEGAPG